MKVGINEVKDILLGETPIVKVYRGEDVIWERGGLPSGYTKVEYLESTGTQYIDTGIGVLTNCDVYLTVKYEKSQGENVFAGCWSIYTGFMFGNSNGFCIVTTQTGWVHPSNKIYPDDNIHTFTINNEGGFIDDVKLHMGASVSKKDNNIYLFKANVFGRPSIGLKIYGYKYYDGDKNLLRDFIPCLDNNNRPCMFDLVTKQPFYNQGTGEFLYA